MKKISLLNHYILMAIFYCIIFKLGKNNMIFIHTVLLIKNNLEMKTKPIQHSIQKLRSYGLFPDFLCVRSSIYPSEKIFTKLSLFTQLPLDRIIINLDSRNDLWEDTLEFRTQWQKSNKEVNRMVGVNLQNQTYNLNKY